MKHSRIHLPNCDMVAYVPDDAIDSLPPRPSIVICPGGGYAYRSPREAEPIALAFAARGFHCYVAEYRVAPAVHPAPLWDVAHAVAWVRAHAAENHADPDRIAVMGFSAGGHAAGSLGVCWHDAALLAPTGLTPEQARPNAMVLCYPVITGGAFAHRGSFEALSGSADRTAHEALSLETKVTAFTPPTFLWHTFADDAVPVENTLMMAAALRRAGVVTELHVFPFGGHGMALANWLTSNAGDEHHNRPECAQWPEMAVRFLHMVM